MYRLCFDVTAVAAIKLKAASFFTTQLLLSRRRFTSSGARKRRFIGHLSLLHRVTFISPRLLRPARPGNVPRRATASTVSVQDFPTMPENAFFRSPVSEYPAPVWRSFPLFGCVALAAQHRRALKCQRTGCSAPPVRDLLNAAHRLRAVIPRRTCPLLREPPRLRPASAGLPSSCNPCVRNIKPASPPPRLICAVLSGYRQTACASLSPSQLAPPPFQPDALRYFAFTTERHPAQTETRRLERHIIRNFLAPATASLDVNIAGP